MSLNTRLPSSTDELLDLIKLPSERVIPNVKSASPKDSSQIALTDVFRKRATVGVVFSGKRIGVAYVSSNNVEYKFFDSPEGVDILSTGFSRFVKTCIENVVGAVKRFDVWIMIPEGTVDIFHFSLPTMSIVKLNAAVKWTLKKDCNVDLSSSIIEWFDVGKVREGGVLKKIICAVVASRSDVDCYCNIIKEAGFKVKGIQPPSLAFSEILKRSDRLVNRSCVSVYIGRQWSRIDIYKKTNLVFVRSVKSGIESIVSNFKNEFLRKTCSVSCSSHEDEIELSLNSDDDLNIVDGDYCDLFYNSLGINVDGKSDIVDVDNVVSMASESISRLVRQIQLTIDNYKVKSGDDVSVIYLSGELSCSDVFMKSIQGFFSIPIRRTDDLLAFDFQIKQKDRKLFGDSIAIASSSLESSCNLANTYYDRYLKKLIKKTVISSYFCNSVMILGLLFFNVMIGGEISKLTKNIEAAEIDIKSLGSVSNYDLVGEAGTVSKIKEEFKSVSASYSVIAALGDISRFTPSEIKILKIEVNKNQRSIDLASKFNIIPIEIEGMVVGVESKGDMETLLSQFVFNLGHSKFIKSHEIISTNFENRMIEGPSLEFKLNVSFDNAI